jgi:UDP-N-acetylglucosamine--N-acetylmuramyl-(pentapeptide) pyrophosphoryl-undecaprenol N-acetylglucosamine transferase
MKSRLLIAGGGTGGHVLPGVAIAEQRKAKFGADAEVLFVGARGGIEQTLVPKNGFPLKLLRIGSLKRVSLLTRLKTAVQLPLSIFHAAWIVAKFSPRAVVGVGGYASGPVLFAAALMSPFFRFRTAILEPNAVPGLTNRWLGRLVRRIYLSFDFKNTGFPASKVQVTGTPIRSQMSALPPAKADPFTVFIFGGSQGALGVNTLVIEALEHLGALKDRLAFIHQTGQRDYDRVLQAHQKAGTRHRVEKFIYDMKSAYAEASLVICRSGASSLSELAAVHRASILVPLPTAADDHQRKNADLFWVKGASLVLDQNSDRGADLARVLSDLVAHPEKLRQMEQKSGELFQPQASLKVIDDLLRV